MHAQTYVYIYIYTYNIYMYANMHIRTLEHM